MIFVANSRRSTEPLYICVVPTTDKNLLAGDVTLDLRLWHPVVRYFIYVRFVKIQGSDARSGEFPNSPAVSMRICNPKGKVTTFFWSLRGFIALQMLILIAAELQIRLNGEP